LPEGLFEKFGKKVKFSGDALLTGGFFADKMGALAV
jgi:hypothetical protein